MNYIDIQNSFKESYDGFEIDKFLTKIRENGSILDIGCGTGEFLKVGDKYHFKMTGIDISEIMVEFAKEQVPNANVLKMGVYHLEDLEEQYDGIQSSYVFVHVPREKIENETRQISQRLNSNGIFYGVFTSELGGVQQEFLEGDINYYPASYTNDEIQDILERNGFEILNISNGKVVNDAKVGVVIARKVE